MLSSHLATRGVITSCWALVMSTEPSTGHSPAQIPELAGPGIHGEDRRPGVPWRGANSRGSDQEYSQLGGSVRLGGGPGESSSVLILSKNLGSTFF